MVGSFNSLIFISFRFFTLVIIGLIMHHPKEGTKHFIQQRLTAVVNIVLGVIVFNFFINNINKSYNFVLDGLSNNLMWLIVIIFTLSMSFHMWIGLNHILDDYVDGIKTRSILGRLNSIMVTIVALATSLLMVNIALL
ncbi:MAG: succinate dehydrogenase, hydrophobic membrane anchor protein [Rhizobiales bacterium TMED94]|jgi:succinate dehydrogenase / fumarate reductase membrane anchor subunit|nr:succinate dehydrogenase, hydrophobic membrane anchor protein [Rhodobiaceae bacterium]RPF88564.1 MAG: succinate dehydrogenase, hydrophobic membrane anchor protein [Rhizobiales bacterium TMED94]